jgi:protein-ribulosamine 3-kinase
MWDTICKRLSQKLGKPVDYRSDRSIAGGCIHNAQALETSQGMFFVKINRPECLPVFEGEAAGLKAIHATKTIRCPKVYLFDLIAGQAVLILEYIPMQGAGPGGMTAMGQQLAALHKVTNNSFGWHIDNNIGLTPQDNSEEEAWISFFRIHRLEYQINLCEKKGLSLPGKEEVLNGLESFFQDYEPAPSLLHGDLWGGNVSFDSEGNPIVFDPACYFGDREADLAFTEMFGGFTSDFYEAYNKAFPLHSGYNYRKKLYNLYHELNHYYLFGGGYGRQAQETVLFLQNVL